MLAARTARTIALRVLLVVVLGTLALAGTAGAASTDPQVQIAPADQAWAETMLLTSRDLGGGWNAVSPGGSGGSSDASGSALCPGFNPNESDLVVTGGSSSPNFTRADGAFASSAATIWQTAEHAQADWDRLVQPPLLNCLASAISAGSSKKVKIVVRSKQPLAFPAVAPRTAAYRLALSFKASVKVRGKLKKISLPATFDFVLLGSGRATGLLFFISFNAKPLSDGYKQSLALRMTQRMAQDPNAAP
jgi:hypothetical protein